MALESLLGILGNIGEYIAPIGRQFGYLIYYERNIKNLETEDAKLVALRAGKQQLVDAAKRNAEDILPNVELWLTHMNAINEEARTILEAEATVNKGCLKGWCPNPKARHGLSRKAKKKIDDIDKLKVEGNSIGTVVSCRPPPLGIESTTNGNFKGFESRRAEMNKVMDALKDEGINMIGICGMGGIGKTTMVNELGIRAKKEKLFDEVVMAVVSQIPNLVKIQAEIAYMLGLKFDEESDLGRAGQLRSRLLQDNKPILVILDDVWEKLDLEAIGIPFGSHQKSCCKIIFTSRNRDVWSEIRTKVDIAIDVLTKDEAWHLFRETVGNSVDTTELRPVAEEIVNECGCLPLALVIIGSALTNRSKHVWKDTLRQLKMPCPKNISSGVPAKVYQSLELSYNYLEDEEAKSCFLLCCLFPEDFNIPIETLVRYGMGLQLFEGIDALEETRDRVHALTEKLRGCFLLLEGQYEESVRMHDVVRDVAISIASRVEHGFLIRDGANMMKLRGEILRKRCASISVLSELQFEGFDCPVLELLRLKGVNLPDNLFEGMSNLKVLELQDMTIPSLPSSLTLLKNIRTLVLIRCWMKNISVIGELKKLEILSFINCPRLELPKEIGQLTNLRLLDLKYASYLVKISPGVLSGLSQLEELYMPNFEKRSNASLTELKSMTHLNVLEIRIPDPNLWPKDLLLENLRRFSIMIGEYNDGFMDKKNLSEKNLSIVFDAGASLEGGINILLKSATTLHFKVTGLKNVINEPLREGFVHSKHLTLWSSDTQDEYLANAMDLAHHAVFPVLESLKLSALPNLKEICHGQLPSGSFGELQELGLRRLPELIHLWKGSTQSVCLGNLRTVYVSKCNRMGSLFSQSVAKTLGQLERLQLYDCKMMEEIVLKERGEDQATNKIEFPKLKTLKIKSLRSLTDFCKGVEVIGFPQLEFLSLSELPKLKSFNPIMSILTSEGNHDATLQSLFNQKVAFPSLEMLVLQRLSNINEIWCSQLPKDQQGALFINMVSLWVISCETLRNLFSPSMARGLVHLQKLEIEDCLMMEEVVAKEGDEEEQDQERILFPQLNHLELKKLPKLRTFCHVTYALELPLLENVVVYDCPALETFSLGSLSTSKLRDVQVNNVEVEEPNELVWMENLNDTIRHLYKEKNLKKRQREMMIEDE